MSVEVLNYKASPTAIKFHNSNAFVRGIRGPVGSGKSSMCALECFLRARQQAKSPEDGIRYTRFAVIRNTYPELISTTIKTWEMWFQQKHFGKIKKSSPITFHFKKGDIDMEVLFISCDRVDDVKKLLSLELTGAWLNEARELPYEILQGATERVRRYPPPKMGGTTFCGVWMDTNSMAEHHWWAMYEKAIRLKQPLDKRFTVPKDWEFFAQPPAVFEHKLGAGQSRFEVNPEAENIEFLNKGYYEALWQGKSKAHVRVMLGNQFGSLGIGEGVYENEWNSDLMEAPEPIVVNAAHPVIVGMDSTGLHPAAVFSQKIDRRWIDIDEVVTNNMAADVFAEEVKSKMAALEKEAGAPLTFVIWGDPAGANKRDTDGKSFHHVLRLHGIRVQDVPMHMQGTKDRIEAGRRPMIRMVNGEPGYLCSPRCRMLIAGFNGNYTYEKKPKALTQFDLKEVPLKNMFSHVHEARQYGYIASGEFKEMQGTKRPSPRVAKTVWKPF